MEKPQSPEQELQEKLERFKEEFQGGIEFIQEAGELGLDPTEARINCNDFDDWEGLQDNQESLTALIKEMVGEDAEVINEYEIEGAEGVGKIKATIYSTNQPGVRLVRYRYEDGSTAVSLVGEEFKEE